MLKKIIKFILKKIGYEIRKINLKKYPYDIDNKHIKLFEELEYATATTIERVDALLNAVDYLERNKIEGDFVECGVWKGGSCMAMAKKLLKNDSNKRKIWLFDTFEGMTEPDENDIEVETGIKGKELLVNASRNSEKYNMWAYAPLNEVKNNMIKTGYPIDNIKYIIGKVEDTLKGDDIPEKVSLLRLDTDWYESTKIELEILFPRLVKGGVLIIDDYGHFEGARKAVDEYFSQLSDNYFMHRIDYSARIIIKN